MLDAQPGTSLLAYSELLTRQHWVDLWSRVLGRQCRVELVTLDRLENEMPGYLAKEVYDSFIYASQYGYGVFLVSNSARSFADFFRRRWRPRHRVSK